MICSDELGRDTARREFKDFLRPFSDRTVTWLISSPTLEVCGGVPGYLNTRRAELVGV